MNTFTGAEMNRMTLLDERLQRGEKLSLSEQRFYSAHQQNYTRRKQTHERFVEVALNEHKLLPSLSDVERQHYVQWVKSLRYNVQKAVDLLRAKKGQTALWEISVAFWLRIAPEQGEGHFVYVVYDGEVIPSEETLMVDGEPISVCKDDEYYPVYLHAWKAVSQLRRAAHQNCSCPCPLVAKWRAMETTEKELSSVETVTTDLKLTKDVPSTRLKKANVKKERISIAVHEECASVLTAALFGSEGADGTFRQGVFTKTNRALANGKRIEHARAYLSTTLDSIRRDMNRSRAADNGGHSRIEQKLDAVGITAEPLRTVMGTLMYLGGVETGLTYQRVTDEVRAALINLNCEKFGMRGSEIYMSEEDVSGLIKRAFREPQIGEETRQQLMSRFFGAREVLTDRKLPDDDESRFEEDLVVNALAGFDTWNDPDEDEDEDENEDNVEKDDHLLTQYPLKERCLKLALEQPKLSTRQVVKIVISELLAENGALPEAIVEVLEDDAIHGHIAGVAKEINSDLRALRGINAEVSWSIAD